ncbi:MAG: hypothetical protein ACJAUD_000004 [Crocinitomicaceae bacterium]|jgi:hypothetical protein
MEFYLKNIRPWLHIGALTALGILMISQPHLFDEVDEGGRKAAIKWVFSYIWGIPAGILSFSIAGFLIYRFLRKKVV